ncbi:hypothetical protein [uncultured Cedecea sp.]|uniref:hypothetical protein n=1 Tax=uncultured Cedecea sp. TaxID=988762 RepID=UPI002618D6D0|nr:hypothetical protein [uncultured Cedecea sp.]
MKRFVIFLKDDETKVVVETNVTREMSKDLKKKGFARYPYAIEAIDGHEAINKLNQQGEKHLNELSQFSGSIFFYCAILVVFVVVAWIFY